MNMSLRFLLPLTQRTDLLLATLLMAVIFMMILPMPTVVVDVLIATNMTLSVLLLMVAIYLRSPLGFTAFPAVLLITTLFRLALSITTTRLILLQADAGKIVETFGNFVVAGNLIVGLVIFLIITIVQFVVITKGSERVAEVSARFSLDAMPGKQMSIDGDMRSGNIDMEEAKRRRSAVERESQLYGAMDGAMKFVKGDAIAGLIIIFVNILGGISIGTLQRGLEASEALRVYSILTIGDGLVSQIPALLIAITAGIIVTRVSAEEDQANLGKDIGDQIVGEPKALLVAAVILVGFAFIPGFPTVIFLIIAAVVGVGGLVMTRLRSSREAASADSKEIPGLALVSGDAEDDAPEPDGSAGGYQITTPLIVDVSSRSKAMLDPESLNRELIRLRRALYFDLGVPFPGIYLRYNGGLEAGKYVIMINEIPVCQGQIDESRVLVRETVEDLEIVNIPSERGEDFLPNLPTVLVAKDLTPRLDQLGLSYMREADIITYHLAFVLKQHGEEFLGIQETKHIVDAMEADFSELVREAQRVLSIQKINEILKRLVSEDVSIRNLRTIFEALIEWGQKEKDIVLLVEYVRGSLGRHICHKYRSPQNVLSAYMFTPDVEETIRNEIRQTSSGSYLALDPAVVRKLIARIKETVGDLNRLADKPVLLTSMDIRRYVRKMIEGELYDLPVLSYQELTKDINIQPLGRVSL